MFFSVLIITAFLKTNKHKTEVRDWVKNASDIELTTHLQNTKGGFTMSSWEAERNNRRLNYSQKELKRRGINKTLVLFFCLKFKIKQHYM